MKQYDYAVVIGRFQPFHVGHQHLFDRAFEVAKHVIVLAGSANQARTLKNPFTVEERSRMFSLLYPDEQRAGFFTFKGVEDFAYNDQKWILEIQKAIDEVVFSNAINIGSKVCIVGHKKDDSSYYLDMFPQYDYVEVDRHGPISASDVRENYFGSDDDILIMPKGILERKIFMFLVDWKHTFYFRTLREEYKFIKEYKQQWEFTPYEPTFVTTDAVIIESGHILLIERKNFPGMGLYALPGGFLDSGERVEDSCIREIHEETKLKVPKKVLKGSIESIEVFDTPDRDPRGRTVTHAFLFLLSPCPDPKYKLTPVKGADDAKKAFWMPLSQVKKLRHMFFSDHWEIIMSMIEKSS